MLYGIHQVLAFPFLSELLESINISVSSLTQEIKQYSMTPITMTHWVFWKWSGEQEEQYMALQRPQRHRNTKFVLSIIIPRIMHNSGKVMLPHFLQHFRILMPPKYRNMGHRSNPESKDLPYMLQYDCSLPHHWNDIWLAKNFYNHAIWLLGTPDLNPINYCIRMAKNQQVSNKPKSPQCQEFTEDCHWSHDG